MFRTTVGQVTVLGGRQYDGATNTLVDERPPRISPGRDRGNLYVLVETPRAEEHETVARQLAEVAQRAYTARRGSVTAGLQQAVHDANRLLYDDNRTSLPTEQHTAGISCVALHGDHLFIAQAGPGAIYVAHEDQVTRFPDASPWLDDIPPEEVDAAPLGTRSELNVALFHIPAGPGDVILLVESGLARGLPPQAWGSILTAGRAGGSQAVLDKLLEAAPGHDLTALAVTIGDEGVSLEPEPAAPRSAAAAKGTAVVEQLSRWAGQLELGDRLRAAAQAVAAVLVSLWVALRALAGRMMPGGAPGGGQTRRSQTWQAGRRAGPLAARASEPETVRRPGRSRGVGALTQGETMRKILIGIAIAIPLIVALLVVITVVQRGRTRQAELNEAWQAATTNWQKVDTVSVPAAQRTYLTTALGSLDHVLELKPGDNDALELRKQVVARLDQVNGVKRVDWVGELHGYAGSADLSRVVVQGMHVFVMDRKSGQVYHYQLATGQQSLQPDSKVVVKKGEQIDGTLVNDLVDMVWMGIDQGNIRQRSALVVFESGGALIEYDPTTGERRALTVTPHDAENQAKFVGSHSGRFYVLDPKTNKILRYDPTANGYGGTPDEWLETPTDLVGVIDWAIGDGIYLLYADSRIVKLALGNPVEFSTADWDVQLLDATALSGYPPDETEWIYVADCGNSRIVQTDITGKFARQFRLSDEQVASKGDLLSKITSLFVDKSAGHAFFLSDNKLYVISLSE